MSATLSQAYHILFLSVIFVLVILVLLCLIRAIKGPTIADRIIAINMIGTLTMIIIGILAVYLQEGYLVDVCLVYAMLSFLAVIVLTKIYNGVYKERKSEIFMKQEKTAVQSEQSAAASEIEEDHAVELKGENHKENPEPVQEKE